MTQISKLVLRATAAATFIALAPAAFAAPNVDANIELDSTYNSGSSLGYQSHPWDHACRLPC